MNDIVIVPRDELERTDRGQYFLAHKTLREMGHLELFINEAAFNALVQMNPDFEFSIEPQPFNDGTLIRWRRV